MIVKIYIINFKEFRGNQSFAGCGFGTYLLIGGNYFIPNEPAFLFVQFAGLGEGTCNGKEKKRQNQKATCNGCMKVVKTPMNIDKIKHPHKMQVRVVHWLRTRVVKKESVEPFLIKNQVK